MRADMKQNTQRKGNATQPPGRNVIATTKVKKTTNRQKGQTQKPPVVLSVSVTEAVNQQLSAKIEINPLTKIKLQLFPLDELTRIGLEKDGLNPFLELTLKARKKISSVIKHIHTKWSGSHIAIGEPMLLPYDAHLRNSPVTRKWTSKDSNITAGDVYTALQTPATFRLSYGWFSDQQPQMVSAPTDMHNCIKSEDVTCLDATTQVAVNANLDTEVKIGQSHGLLHDDNMTNLSMGGLFSEASLQGIISNNELKSNQSFTDISIGGLLSEASLQEKINQNEQQAPVPITWDDNLTALSIGGLLSEASLQAKINNNNNNNKCDGGFISDSLDAIVTSHVKTNCSSILDAEETCHAFAFKKFSSSNKNVRVTARSTHDSTSNPFRFPNLPEVEREAEKNSGPESKTELFSCSQQFGEDSSNLGLKGITWNESLGPFDLGNSMPWKIFGGGNI